MSDAIRGTITTVRAMYETFAISAPTVLDAALGRVTRPKCDARLARWSQRLLAQADVALSVSGREHLEPGRPYVVMSNHASYYDIPILFQAFPGTLRMVAKTELFKIPIFAGAMTAAGFIEIDRTNRERAIESLRRAKQRLNEGISIWIAPEGTRSRTGELGEFKKGGFVLAMQTGLPVVPTAIVGSSDVIAHGAQWVRSGARTHVAFQPPIVPPARDTVSASRAALMTEVRGAIERGLIEARAHLASDNAAR